MLVATFNQEKFEALLMRAGGCNSALNVNGNTQVRPSRVRHVSPPARGAMSRRSQDTWLNTLV